MATHSNLLTNLPPHVFVQGVASYLNAEHLLALENSGLLTIVDGHSPLIQMCFDEMTYFKMIPNPFTDLQVLREVLFRAGKGLQRYEFFTETARHFPSYVFDDDGDQFSKKLADKFPNLIGFHSSVWRECVRLISSYIEHLDGECKLVEVRTNSIKLIKRCPNVKKLILDTDCNWSEKQLKEVVVAVPKLEELRINVNPNNAIALKLCLLTNITRLRVKLLDIDEGQTKIIRRVAERPQLKEISIDIKSFRPLGVASIGPLIELFNPLIVREFRASAYHWRKLIQFTNVVKVSLDSVTSEILTFLCDRTNLTQLKSIKLLGMNSYTGGYKTLFKTRGHIIHRLDISTDSSHREFVNDLVEYCTKLSRAHVQLSSSESVDDKLGRNEMVKLANMYVKKYIHFHCTVKNQSYDYLLGEIFENLYPNRVQKVQFIVDCLPCFEVLN